MSCGIKVLLADEKKCPDDLLCCFQRIADVFAERLRENGIRMDENGFCVWLRYDPAITHEGYRMETVKEGVEIAAATATGLLSGIGTFLRTSVFDGEFVPTAWRGESVPDCPVRGVQMDTHFCNYYHMAAEDELRTYVEDLALWGINTFDVVFPLIDFLGWNDPEITHLIKQLRAIAGAVRDMGLSIGLEIVPNQDFVLNHKQFIADKNEEPVRRRGNNGNNMCPNRPGALNYIVNTYEHVIRHLKENEIPLDFLCFWPYDEGGCSCEKCAPWGANGYLKASKAIFERAKEILPGIRVILSTWLFDTPSDEGEWSGLAKALEKENGWVDAILADSHTDYPRYPLTNRIPGNLPLLNYPEISMWALFPWGGYGANPLPARFERLWRQVREKVSGGITYSEGIFDDINKCVIAGFYWNRGKTAKESLEEYIRWYFGDTVIDQVYEAICLIEENHVATAVGNERAITRDSNTRAVTEEVIQKAERALTLLGGAKSGLRTGKENSWRFRILFIRASLDVERFNAAWEKRGELSDITTWTDVLKGNEKAISLMKELTEIYHSRLDTDVELHPMFKCVRPALQEISS